MSNFDFYDLALETDNIDLDLTSKSKKQPKGITKSITECDHNDTIFENGNELCVDCGEEIFKDIANDKEWRYYGHSDNKHTSDPTRCQVRKSEDR